MKLVWLTDLHLDFINDEKLLLLLKKIKAANSSGIIISGDISNSYSIEENIIKIYNFIKKPIYYVTGNHDYYGSSIESVNNKLLNMHQKNSDLKFLNVSGIIRLDGVSIIGHSGWYDGRFGDYHHSNVILNDIYQIKEFYDAANKSERLIVYKRLADESVYHFKNLMSDVFDKTDNLILVTHVSPFKESSVYNGKQSDDNWLPFFTSKCLGVFLKDVMKKYKNKKLLVLCGHAHGNSDVQILKNLRVLTGEAEYRNPRISKILDTTTGW